MLDKQNLIRIAKKIDGTYYIDKTKSPIGRGAYVCRCAKCVAKAAKSAGVERSFGQKDKLGGTSVNIIYEQLAMETLEIER